MIYLQYKFCYGIYSALLLSAESINVIHTSLLLCFKNSACQNLCFQ